MSGLFASLSVGKAWEKLSSFLRAFPTASSSSSSASQQDDLEELQKLERTMRRIRATLHDAEEHWNIREESAKLRLKELKEVAYDIEDVVDEYEYEVNRCELVALDRSVSVPNTGKRKHQEVLSSYHLFFSDKEKCFWPLRKHQPSMSDLRLLSSNPADSNKVSFSRDVPIKCSSTA